MEPLGIHHVSINVDDVDAALAFYVGDLGFRVRDDRPDLSFGGAWLDAGGQQVHLIEAAVPADQGQHFALRVGDLPATVEELRAKGHTVTDPSGIAGNWQAFLNDPAGNRVELQEVATA